MWYLDVNLVKTEFLILSTPFHIGIKGVTWGDRGLQRVTGGYKGWQGVTRGDMGWQGVTKGYRGWQGVTKGLIQEIKKGYRGYKRLQGVAGGYKGWKGVTKDVRNFFLTRTFPNTFSWSILRKNQSWRNLYQNDELTPLQKFSCCVFNKQIFW